MNLIIDEAILDAVKSEPSAANCQYCTTHRVPLEATLKGLWQIARAAKRWMVAPAGREASQRESELAELLFEMPPTPVGHRRGDENEEAI